MTSFPAATLLGRQRTMAEHIAPNAEVQRVSDADVGQEADTAISNTLAPMIWSERSFS
jgi:hypothetical protein